MEWSLKMLASDLIEDGGLFTGLFLIACQDNHVSLIGERNGFIRKTQKEETSSFSSSFSPK
jgi:hypothetical protein